MNISPALHFTCFAFPEYMNIREAWIMKHQSFTQFHPMFRLGANQVVGFY